MLTHRARMCAVLSIGFFVGTLVAPSLAQHSVFPPPLVVPQVTPQFNEPGPQIVIPPPGNPVQQLSPSLGTASPVYSTPEIYSFPEEPPRITAHHHRRHAARQRHVSHGHVEHRRSGEPPRARTR